MEAWKPEAPKQGVRVLMPALACSAASVSSIITHIAAMWLMRGRVLAERADYVGFLASVTPDNQDEYILQMRRFNLGPVGEADCPVFDGMFDYCAVREAVPSAACLLF